MSDGRPLVSVVIPTYNHAQYLAAAIRSVDAQTYGPVEIIVVDNFSSDGTEQVVAAHQGRPLHYLKFANDGIIAASRNAGIRVATGEYVAFLDADDEWAPEKLARQVPHLADPALAGVASDLRYIGALSYSPSRHGRGPLGYRDVGYSEIVWDNPVPTSSVVVRRADLERLGGFDESREFRVIEDWELWLRLAAAGPIRIVGAPLVTYRVAATERPRLPILISKLALLDKHRRLGLLSEGDARTATASVHFAMGVAAFASDGPLARQSFRAARRAVRTRVRAVVASAAILASYAPAAWRARAYRGLRWLNRQLRFE